MADHTTRHSPSAEKRATVGLERTGCGTDMSCESVQACFDITLATDCDHELHVNFEDQADRHSPMRHHRAGLTQSSSMMSERMVLETTQGPRPATIPEASTVWLFTVRH